MATVDEILAKAKPVERTVWVCVAGDLAAEYEQKVHALAEAEDDTNGRLSGKSTKALRDEVEKLGEQMRESTFPFTMKALGSLRFSNLMAEHPDPDGNRAFEVDTFLPALFSATCVDPEGMDDQAQVDALFDVLTPAQRRDLLDAAWDIHDTTPKGLTS